MIVVRSEFTGMRGGTHCQIWLREKPDLDFEKRLVNELFAIAQPVGLGHIVALGRKNEDIGTILDEAMAVAPYGAGRSKVRKDFHYYDYIAGYRIKVDYYPDGIPVFEDDPETEPLYILNRGKPYIGSVEFDEMYGEGSLERVVRLALGKVKTDLV